MVPGILAALSTLSSPPACIWLNGDVHATDIQISVPLARSDPENLEFGAVMASRSFRGILESEVTE